MEPECPAVRPQRPLGINPGRPWSFQGPKGYHLLMGIACGGRRNALSAAGTFRLYGTSLTPGSEARGAGGCPYRRSALPAPPVLLRCGDGLTASSPAEQAERGEQQ